MMTVQSQVPASPEEALLETPFSFTVDGNRFQLPMLTYHGYIRMERSIHGSVYALLFHRGTLDAVLAERFRIHPEKVSMAKNLIGVLIQQMEPVPFYRLVGMLLARMLRYWFAPNKWAFTLQRYLEQTMTLDTLIPIVSLWMRYCAEKKNALYQILQEGIGSVTKNPWSANPTSSPSSGEAWKQGYQSLGQELLDSSKP